MAAITLNNVAKIYHGDVKAVRDINLDIKDGEFVVLVGPSGCGKSTLLRMVAGLETISEGDVTIGERRVNNLEPAERDIAMVFQNYALYPHMSVRQNLSYGLKNRKIPKDEIERRVKKVSEILFIADYLDRKPRQLSGGQRQRVAMGRAIVREPAVFLFDEPLSNLDAQLRVQMRAEIRKLHQQLKTTSIYVTHDQLEAMTLADKLVVMNAGHIEQVGTPMELYDNPQTMFVAGFIGSPSMNFLNAALVNNKTIGTEKDLVIGMRPHDLTLMENVKNKKDFLTIDLTVSFVEPVGSETHIYGNLGDKGPEVTMILEGFVTFKDNSKITIGAPLNKIHLFNEKTKKRVHKKL